MIDSSAASDASGCNVDRLWVVLTATAMLAGCGGSGGGNEEEFAPSRLVVLVTDAPIDDAESVVIAIADFELKPVGSDPIRLPLFGADPTSGLLELDFTELTNGASEIIVRGEHLPAGQYEWMRIFFDESASHIQLNSDGSTYPLLIPGSEAGLTLNDEFSMPVNERETLILDFNLRSSVIEVPNESGPNGEPRRFELRPGVRVINFSDKGEVQGIVDASLVDINNERCLTAIPPLTGNAVYVFEGLNAGLEDVANEEIDSAAPPLTSDVVEFNITEGQFEYHLMFLPQGAYTLAFTCSARADGANDDDYPAPSQSGFNFDATINVDVVAGETKHCAIPAEVSQLDPC